MGGGMEANKNKFIEEWGAARENLEHNFRWTRRNFALVGLFGIAIPILVYKGIVKEFPDIGKFTCSTCKMKMQAGPTGSFCEYGCVGS